MKTYKGNSVASDDLSIVQSPDKFHEGDQYAGRENVRSGAWVSRDSPPTMDVQKGRRKKWHAVVIRNVIVWGWQK